jgi:hypothetical protein
MSEEVRGADKRSLLMGFEIENPPKAGRAEEETKEEERIGDRNEDT